MNEAYHERLASYEAVAAATPAREITHEVTATNAPTESTQILSARAESYDWSDLGQQLTRRGLARLPRLLSGEQSSALRAMFEEEQHFAKTVTMDKPRFGKGVYKYFAAPLPEIVVAIRQAVFPFAAIVANQWQRTLGQPETLPDTWEQFREACVAAEQTSPTPLLLRYGVGGFNALHRDLRGEVFFPIQLAIVISPHRQRDNAEDGFTGGEFVLCHQDESPSAENALELGLGDGVLFCTRDRLETCGGLVGTVPVRHGALPVTQGERTVLAVPFHDYLP